MEDFLHHMVAEITKQHQALQIECALLKDLLKPWPRKKSVVDNSENKETKATMSEVQKPPDNFSQEERQALSQVDKLLQKAEKTLHLKSKIKQDVDQDTNLDIQNNKLIDVQNSNNCELTDSSVPSCSITNTAVDIRRTNCSATTLCPPSSKVSSSLKQTSEIQQLESKVNLTDTKQVYSCKHTSETKDKNKDSHITRSRPPSSHKPSSSQVRHKPAHMLAPFKTTNSSSFPKQKKIISQNHASSTRTKTPVPMKVKTVKTLPKVTPANHKQQTKVADTCINFLSPTAYSKTDNTKEIYPVAHSDNNNIENNDKEGLVDHLSQQMSASNSNPGSSLNAAVDHSSNLSSMYTQSTERDQASNILHETHLHLTDPGQEQFTLQKNGATLKLPSKLIKLVHENRSLQKRLSGMKEKVPQIDSAQQFVERLCSQEEISKELRTRVSALTCLRGNYILMDTLQILQLDQLSENTPLEDLYRAKRILEFVLTTFAELQEQADFYSKVKYRKIAPVLRDNKAKSDEQVTLWLETGQHRDLQGDVWDHLQRSKQWAHLKFTEKYLELNILLVKAAQTEWWKSLSSPYRDPTVLQGVYSLLTSHGQFIPALVEYPDVK